MDFSTPFFNAALVATVVSVKGVPGMLSWTDIYNPNATIAYVQVFDAATTGAVTLGTTPPRLSLPVPATGTLALNFDRAGFLNGIQIAATTTSTGSTAPGTGLVVNLGIR